jgi:hypothetical protein
MARIAQATWIAQPPAYVQPILVVRGTVPLSNLLIIIVLGALPWVPVLHIAGLI